MGFACSTHPTALLPRDEGGAGGRQIGNPQGLSGRPRRLWVLCLRGEPPGEFAAPVAGRRRRLILALGLAAGAGEAQVEMIIVPPPRADPPQPLAIRPGFATERALDRRVDENAPDRSTARRGFEQLPVLRPPDFGIDIVAILGD